MSICLHSKVCGGYDLISHVALTYEKELGVELTSITTPQSCALCVVLILDFL